MDLTQRNSVSTDETDSLLENKSNLKDKLKGTFLAFLIVLEYVASAVSVQLLERRIPDLELNAIRSGGSCILYLIVLLLKRRYPYVARRIFKSLFLYTVVTTTLSVAVYIAMAMILSDREGHGH